MLLAGIWTELRSIRMQVALLIKKAYLQESASTVVD